MEAKSSVDRLHGMIERCYQEMSSRMEALELRNLRSSDGSLLDHQPDSDTSSVMTIKAPKFDPSEPERGPNTSSGMITFDFTETLQKSWVYRRNTVPDVSGSSLYTRDTCSMTWSCLSDLSWAEVSNISVIGLPVSVNEVHNPLRSSQTWSNDVIDPIWPVISPVGLAVNTHAAAELPTHGSTIEPPEVDFRDKPSPCRGCRENLQTGKAMKLERHYWHLDCFRCNTCGTMLDSDSNILLLEDGSLICNNCIYCSSCGTRREDVAILTGEEAFCTECFTCRNCKMSIKSLKYARTSQGRFCMDCHDALMARRRRKDRAPAPTCPHCGKTQIGTTSTRLFCTNTECNRYYLKKKRRIDVVR